MKPGSEEQLEQLGRRWEEEVDRGTDSGWLEGHVFRNANDPNEWYQVVYFESEEKARRNERSPKHQQLLEPMMALMDGEPEFVDLTPVMQQKR
jgi:quinol monooxygenase YgiN